MPDTRNKFLGQGLEGAICRHLLPSSHVVSDLAFYVDALAPQSIVAVEDGAEAVIAKSGLRILSQAFETLLGWEP